MEIQLLDADYMPDARGKPIVRLFGKQKNGKTACVFVSGFMPYFYVNKNDKSLEGNPEVVRVEPVRKKVVGKGETELFRVVLNNPAKTPEIRDGLKAKGLTVYEADILFKYRFMSDKGLAGQGWIEVAEEKTASTNAVLADRKVEVKNVSPIEKEEDAPMRVMAFDIECVTGGSSRAPDTKRDPVILISIVFSEPYKGQDHIVLGTRSYKGVVGMETEKEMLEKFMETVREYDPDVLTGYNVNNFDLPYIVERMRFNGIRPVFGRCMQKAVMCKKLAVRYRSYVAGRVIADSYELVKRDFALQRYGLDFVAENLLGEKKDDVKHSEIEKLWRGTDKEYGRLVEYCLKDSVLAMNLITKLNLMDKYKALARVSGILLQDALGGGEAARIENYLLREFNRKGYVFPSKPEAGTLKQLVGGAVLEPDKGLHSNVVMLDFKSMYPSIVTSFNICPTTLTRDRENSMETPSGARFLKKSVREGVLPVIVKQLMEARAQVKDEMKRARSPEKKQLLFAKQWALKIMANAFYGYFGYARSRLYNLDIANAITSTGRKIIQDTKDLVEEKFGYSVIYGDTDSVFVKLDTDDLDEMEKRARAIVDYANGMLPKGIELEFEKVFKRFLPLTKKRYAAWCFVRGADGWEDGIETKGIETVRRDWCPLVSKTVSEILDIMLKQDDTRKALEYFKGVVSKLVKNEIPIKSLVITKTMTKAAKSYAGVQPHIELAKKMQARSPVDAPGVGDRIGYVIIKGPQLLSKRTEDPMYVIEHGLQTDSQYYIENQLLPPLERLFSALGVEKSQLLGNGRQMGLMEIMKSHANAAGAATAKEETVAETIGRKDMQGFMCRKCHAFYRRPPLAGYCACGGELLFSSSKGLARFLVAG
jgi:DNA polymerase I